MSGLRDNLRVLSKLRGQRLLHRILRRAVHFRTRYWHSWEDMDVCAGPGHRVRIGDVGVCGESDDAQKPVGLGGVQDADLLYYFGAIVPRGVCLLDDEAPCPTLRTRTLAPQAATLPMDLRRL